MLLIVGSFLRWPFLRLDTANKAVLDQVMRHEPNSNVFQAYLNRRAGCHVQAAFFERPSADGLLKAFSHMGLTCDPRAPPAMPDEVFSMLPPDPEIVALQDRRDRLKAKIQAKSTITEARKRGCALFRDTTGSWLILTRKQ